MGIHSFELSAGLYKKGMQRFTQELSKKYKLQIHNYFPPHKDPFIFNLASLDDDIAAGSIKHAKNAIKHCQINSKYFSFHAGYLIDPQVDELGKEIRERKINPIDESMEVFVNRVNMLAEYAQKKDIKLLIENNVISYKNFTNFRKSPLMMVNLEETYEIMNKTNSNVGLLIDVAHLKVSANSMGFSKEEYLNEFYDYVSAYHLSDNDGTEDSNCAFNETSWFWEHINKDLDYYSIEVYKKDAKFLRTQLELASNLIKL